MTASTVAESPSGRQTAGSVFNPTELVQRCMGDAESAFGLLGLFRERLPAAIAEISDLLLVAGDVPAALPKLHTLKGNAGNLAAGRLYQAAAQLEQILRRGRFSDMTSHLTELKQEATRLLQALPADLHSLLNKPCSLPANHESEPDSL